MDLEKFTGHSNEYLKYRHAYPDEFITYLYEEVGVSESSSIADIGSGTGKLSKQLLLQGSKVYCVEPNQHMRETAEKELGNFLDFISISGTAEDTTLPDSSVDFITVGTAFHWFDEERFKKECQRILKPKGKVILVWNGRPVNRTTVWKDHESLEMFVINFDGTSGGKEEHPELFSSFFRDSNFDYRVFKEKVTYHKDHFIGRVATTFHHLTDDKYIDELGKLFDDHSENGFLSITLLARCIIGEV
ncbi:MAG: Methyltransferase [Herbinix sp.]|jgi:ubiquinone/menaquinone biosynthesis C-methylase UbiE|nr:Methyltransferase [Herbinix sp.]